MEAKWVVDPAPFAGNPDGFWAAAGPDFAVIFDDDTSTVVSRLLPGAVFQGTTGPEYRYHSVAVLLWGLNFADLTALQGRIVPRTPRIVITLGRLGKAVAAHHNHNVGNGAVADDPEQAVKWLQDSRLSILVGNHDRKSHLLR